MYELIAEYNDFYQEEIGGPFKDHPCEEIVALFSSMYLAGRYIRKARLKNPVRGVASTRVFRKNSLLYNAVAARIESHTPTDLPLNPTL